MRVAVNGEEVDRAAHEVVIALVAGEREVAEIRRGAGCLPIVVAERRKEAVARRAGWEAADVGKIKSA